MTRTEYEVLGALDDMAGMVIPDIGRHVSYCRTQRRVQSATLRYVLARMERDGLVRKLDDKKPIAWVRTDAGRGVWLDEERKCNERETYCPACD